MPKTVAVEDKAKAAAAEEKAKAAAVEARKERAARLLRELYELWASGTVRERKPSDELLRAAQPERDEALES